ncbi:cupin domain-containing protein [Cohnella thermotolerans]|uniref:cupin domain-containing protein n=1 Tax=Cohnella thermotolerans TaxID=329858 RepID=UPI00042806E9|nr:cupin domain-containing protein [Cohnella thermotolerans]
MSMAAVRLMMFRDDAERIESAFHRHNWRNSWTGGVYDYHHYHTNTHEALGVVRGSATLRLGGESGQDVEIRAGDVLVLPAGTGHRRLRASGDFLAVGAYPDGMNWNLKTAEDGGRDQALSDIQRVPLPETDPVYGNRGPLLDHWREASAEKG